MAIGGRKQNTATIARCSRQPERVRLPRISSLCETDAHCGAGPLQLACPAESANIRYFLSAATWQYYRFVFRFSLEETIACADTAIGQALGGLARK
jgi:hypothetical protein